MPLLCAFCITYVGKLDGDEYCLSHKFQIDKLMSFGKRLRNNNYIMCPFRHLQDVGLVAKKKVGLFKTYEVHNIVAHT